MCVLSWRPVCLCPPAAAEPHCLHPGCTEVATEKSLQLLHTTLLSLLRYTHIHCQTHCDIDWMLQHLQYKWPFPLHCYVGSDLLKLTRDDLVQICGPADGIRLFNALKSRCVSLCVFFEVVFTCMSNMKVPQFFSFFFLFHFSYLCVSVCTGLCVPGWLCTSVRSPLARAPCWKDMAAMKTETTASPLVYTVNKLCVLSAAQHQY